MSRNGSGAMTVLNTFAPGEVISSSDHNDNFSDIADELTNSVAADGQTSMTGQLKLSNGSASAPAVSFASDTNTGGYRIGADNYGIAVGGTKIVDVASTGITITGTLTPTGQILSADGTVSAPGLSFTNEADCGFYKIGTNNIGFALNGAKVVDYATTGLSVTGTVTASLGMTVTAGGLTVTAGGLIVTAGGLTVTAGSVSLPAASVADAALIAPGAMKLIKTQVASSSATIDFQNGVNGVVLDDTYDDYIISLSNIIPATNGRQLQMQIGTGGTPTYQTTGYYIDGAGAINANAVQNPMGATNTTAIFFGFAGGSGNAVSNDAGAGGMKGRIEFSNPEVAVYPRFIFQLSYPFSTTGNAYISGGGMYASAVAMTALRFKFDSGNIASGRFTLYGLTKA